MLRYYSSVCCCLLFFLTISIQCSTAADTSGQQASTHGDLIIIPSDQAEAFRVVVKLDTNSNGRIERQEFSTVAYPDFPDFHSLDANNDTMISATEIASWLATERVKLGIRRQDWAISNRKTAIGDAASSKAEAQAAPSGEKPAEGSRTPLSTRYLDELKNAHAFVEKRMSSAWRLETSRWYAERLFRRYDKNEDNALGQTEVSGTAASRLLTVVLKGSKPSATASFDELEQAIEFLIDSSNSVRVQSALEHPSKSKRTECARSLLMMDIDGNGEIGFHELLSSSSEGLDVQKFIELDLDRNRSLSFLEFLRESNPGSQND